MNKLKLYRVDVNYIKYLYSFDNKVQYNKEQKMNILGKGHT